MQPGGSPGIDGTRCGRAVRPHGPLYSSLYSPLYSPLYSMVGEQSELGGNPLCLDGLPGSAEDVPFEVQIGIESASGIGRRPTELKAAGLLANRCRLRDGVPSRQDLGPPSTGRRNGSGSPGVAEQCPRGSWSVPHTDYGTAVGVKTTSTQ